MKKLFLEPAGLSREDAAAYVGIGVDTFSVAVREGRAPAARAISSRRVVWLRKELDAWLDSLSIADNLPPPNTGYKKNRMEAKYGRS